MVCLCFYVFIGYIDNEAGHEEQYKEQDLEDYYDVQIFSKVHIGS